MKGKSKTSKNKSKLGSNECDLCSRTNQNIYLTQTQTTGGIMQKVCSACMEDLKEKQLKTPSKKDTSQPVPFLVKCPISEKPLPIKYLAVSNQEMSLLPCCRIFVCSKPTKICNYCERTLCKDCSRDCAMCGESTCPDCFRQMFPIPKCKGCMLGNPDAISISPGIAHEEIESIELPEDPLDSLFPQNSLRNSSDRPLIPLERISRHEETFDSIIKLNKGGNIPSNIFPELLSILTKYNQSINSMKPITENTPHVEPPNPAIFESYNHMGDLGNKIMTENLDTKYEEIILTYMKAEGEYPDNIISQISDISKYPSEAEAAKYYMNMRNSPGINCIRLLTAGESNFSIQLNRSLCAGKYLLYSNYLRTLLQYENNLAPGKIVRTPNTKLWIYMGRALTTAQLGTYKIGGNYYWKCFVRGTSVAESVNNYILRGVDEGICTIFKILLKPNVKNNKYELDLLGIGVTTPITLLFPYFKYKIIDKMEVRDPHTQTPLVLILVHEIEPVVHIYGEERKLGAPPKVLEYWLLFAGKGFRGQAKKENLEEFMGEGRVILADEMGEVRNLLKEENAEGRTYIVITDGFGNHNQIKELGFLSTVFGIIIYNPKKKDWNIPGTIHKLRGKPSHSFEVIVWILAQWLYELQSERVGVPQVRKCSDCQSIYTLLVFHRCTQCNKYICKSCADRQSGKGKTKAALVCKICLQYAKKIKENKEMEALMWKKKKEKEEKKELMKKKKEKVKDTQKMNVEDIGGRSNIDAPTPSRFDIKEETKQTILYDVPDKKTIDEEIDIYAVNQDEIGLSQFLIDGSTRNFKQEREGNNMNNIKNENKVAKQSRESRENITQIVEFVKEYNKAFNKLKIDGEGCSLIMQKQIFNNNYHENDLREMQEEIIECNIPSHCKTMKALGLYPNPIIAQYYSLYENKTPVEILKGRGNHYHKYIRYILSHEKHLSKRIENIYVYRGCSMTEAMFNSTYKEGNSYYFSLFTNTTLAAPLAHTFMMVNSHALNILFIIQLSNEVLYTKYFLKGYSSANHVHEVILLPFFAFQVVEKRLFLDPHTDKRKGVIVIKEIKSDLGGRGIHVEFTPSSDIYFVWKDIGLNDPHDYKYIELLEKLELLEGRITYFHTMYIARQYVAQHQMQTYFIMTDGSIHAENSEFDASKGETKSKGNVAVILLLTSNEYNKWVNENKISPCFQLVLKYISEWVENRKKSRNLDNQLFEDELTKIRESYIQETNTKENPTKTLKKTSKCCRIL